MANPTPFELREKASYQPKIAEQLIDKYPDGAVYNGGYAVELMLKARIRQLKSWSDWPSDSTELKQRMKTEGGGSFRVFFSHKLEKLLWVSESVHLDRSSFSHIDWNLVGDWSAANRYDPVGTLDTEQAKLQCSDFWKVVKKLSRFEVLESILAIEKDISDRYGLFHLFGFFRDPQKG